MSKAFKMVARQTLKNVPTIKKSCFCTEILPESRNLWKYCKVHIFWEGHKNLRDPPYGFNIYLVNVKTIRKIAQMFLAFSEKLNFIEFKNFSR